MAEEHSGCQLNTATSQPSQSQATNDPANTDTNEWKDDYASLPCHQDVTQESSAEQAASPSLSHIAIRDSIWTAPLNYYMSKVADAVDYIQPCRLMSIMSLGLPVPIYE